MSRFIEMFGNTEKVKLGDYITTQSGGTPNTKKSEYYDGGNIPWLSSGEVNQGYIYATEKFITELGLSKSSAKWIPENTVLIAMYGATAGKVGYAKIPLTTNQAVCALLPSEYYNSIFLYYAVSQKTDWMIEQCRGAAQPNISQGIIKSMEIPLPSKEQQQQFVALAEQFDKSVFDGFKSRFIEMFGNEENHTSILSLCDTFIDGDWIEAKDQSESGVRLIQTGNIGIGKYKDKTDKARYISEETFERLKCTEVVEGDILISRLPEPVGRACSIPGGIGKSITAVDCTIVRLNDKVLPEFFIAFTNTPYYAMQIKKVLSGTTRLRISRANLGKIQVPLPSKDRQQQFVTIAKQFDKSV